MFCATDCLCVCFFDSKKTHWVVWLMEEYGVRDSWIKFMTIPHFIHDPCTQFQHGVFRWYHSLEPLRISEDGVVILKTNFSKLVLYSLNDGRLDYPRIRGENMGRMVCIVTVKVWFHHRVKITLPSLILLCISDC
ncbi:F-box/kelch-repeat protein [Spatholobus suberectus]|nr:F-box/kelch-repeat protein [Spatholobus suberectus]